MSKFKEVKAEVEEWYGNIERVYCPFFGKIRNTH
jgi:hypothetical protein